jgi:hypothetical protein
LNCILIFDKKNMVPIKSSLLFFALLTTTLNYGQFTDVINSNRPGESMGGFSVGKTVFQAELGGYGIQEKHDLLEYEANGFGSELSLRYGALFEQLEFNLDLQYQKDWYTSDLLNKTRSGLKQTTIGAKYLFYDPAKNYKKKVNVYSWKANHKFSLRNLIPAVGFYAGVNINLSNNDFSFPTDPKISPKAMLITQNQFGKQVLTINVVADKIMTDYPSYGYILTLTRGINQRWTAFVENQGIQSDFYSDGIFRGGAAFLIQENIQVDANIGTNYKNTPSLLFGGVGLSWRFDENYSEVMTREKKDKKDKDKKGKDKKGKDKSKKRKDGVETTPTK